ncbi:MAG: transcriptional repressor, partial [Anaerovoracaceae bacterium]
IVKVDTPGGTAARFDDTVHEHFHGKCRVCGNVYDIDMDKAHANGLKEKVNDSHGFEIENQEVVFIGVCPNCRK